MCASPAPSGPPPGAAPQRVLVREVNWLGDLVLSLPALRTVRAAWPQAHLTVLVKDDLAGFFDGARWTDEVLRFRAGRGLRGVADRMGLARELTTRHFDLAILFPNSFDAAFWTSWSGIPRRVGYARSGRAPLLTDAARLSHAIRQAHQVHYYLEMLRQTLGLIGRPEDCALDVHPPHREKMSAWLGARRRHPSGPLIALAVAAAYGPAKEWPVGHFAALLNLLAERHGAEGVLVGAPGERAKCAAVSAASRHGALIAAGETGVGEALALLALCDGFAGNDSGSMHLAGALGRPTVGLFGSTRPDRTGPLGPRTRVLQRLPPCGPCLERTCRPGHYECLTQITPEDVRAALEELGAFNT